MNVPDNHIGDLESFESSLLCARKKKNIKNTKKLLLVLSNFLQKTFFPCMILSALKNENIVCHFVFQIKMEMFEDIVVVIKCGVHVPLKVLLEYSQVFQSM